MARRGGRRDPGREGFWREAIGSWARSGQTVRGYCVEHGLKEASFHAWRRTLHRRDAERAQEQAQGSVCAGPHGPVGPDGPDRSQGPVASDGAVGADGPRSEAGPRSIPRTRKPATASPAGARFLPVRVSAMSAPIEVERSGITVRVPGAIDVETLVRIIDALGRATC